MKKYTFEEVLDMNGDFIAFFRRKVPADKSERSAYLLKKEGEEPSLFLTTIALAVVNRSTFWSDRERKRNPARGF